MTLATPLPCHSGTGGGAVHSIISGLPRFQFQVGPRHGIKFVFGGTKSIKPYFPNGIVSSVSFVSTTKTARSLAGFVLLALALTAWRSPGSSEKLCPAL